MTINPLSSLTQISQIAGLGSLSKSAQVAQVVDGTQDSTSISRLGKLIKQLADLQQADPGQFKAETAQIAGKLEAAAKSAADNGDSRVAGVLNEMAARFNTASVTGEFPAMHHIGGGHFHSGDSGTNSSSSDPSIGSGALMQLLNSYQNPSTNPRDVLTGIIQDVFASAQTSSA
jgi:hypothetical protein